MKLFSLSLWIKFYVHKRIFFCNVFFPHLHKGSLGQLNRSSSLMFSRLIIGGGGVGGVVYAGLAGRVFFSHWLVSGLVRGRAACAGLMVWFGLYCLCLGQSGRRLGCRWGAVGRGACYGAGLSGTLACRRAVSSAAGCAIGGPRGWATIGYFFSGGVQSKFREINKL